jgi:hypothetical protein
MTEEPLPRTFLIADTEASGALTDPEKAHAQALMYEMVEAAFGSAGLEWEKAWEGERGDGILIALPPEASRVRLVGALPLELDRRLARHNLDAPGKGRPVLRLRLCVHFGDALRTPKGWVGRDVDLAFDMCNARPVKDLLATAKRARLVVVLGPSLHRAVVRHHYEGVDAEAFAELPVPTREGELGVWVQVPGYPEPPLPRPAAKAPRERPARPPGMPAPPPGSNNFFGTTFVRKAVANGSPSQDDT